MTDLNYYVKRDIRVALLDAVRSKAGTYHIKRDDGQWDVGITYLGKHTHLVTVRWEQVNEYTLAIEKYLDGWLQNISSHE